MARTPKPWFRSERAEWCVHFRGKMHKLGRQPDGFPAPRLVKGKWSAPPPPIQQAFHALLAAPPEVKAPPPPPPVDPAGPTVAEIFDKFLDWCHKHRSPRTYEFYRDRIQSFADTVPAADMAADDLKPFHVQDWIDGKPTWGPMQRRGAIVSVQRPFAWAEKMGHLVKSPVRHVEKPAPKRREQVLTKEEFAALLAAATDQCFRDVLEFCWETGARVQEVRLIEARHWNRPQGRVELPPPEAKGKKRWRIIYLTDRAAGIVDRLAAECPHGPLFRNEDGNPWDAQAFNNRFCRLQHRLGWAELKAGGAELDAAAVRELAAALPKTKRTAGVVVEKGEKELLREARKKLTRKLTKGVGTKYALTAIRHSYATRLLEAGVDHVTVAALMGHVDAVMLSKVYSHVGDRNDFLRAELKKAAG